MEKSKVYTGTGDKGYTSLVGGTRVPKTSPRIEAYGTIDELNAFLACLLDEIDDRDDRQFLLRIQANLFTVGGYLATKEADYCPIETMEIELVEREMDKIDELLPPSKFFILPGGCRPNSMAHVCRTVCRRAERAIYRIDDSAIDTSLLVYVNRLSDYFFLLSRKLSFINNKEEILWEKPCR